MLIFLLLILSYIFVGCEIQKALVDFGPVKSFTVLGRQEIYLYGRKPEQTASSSIHWNPNPTNTNTDDTNTGV